jgi:hypothetical protein
MKSSKLKRLLQLQGYIVLGDNAKMRLHAADNGTEFKVKIAKGALKDIYKLFIEYLNRYDDRLEVAVDGVCVTISSFIGNAIEVGGIYTLMEHSELFRGHPKAFKRIAALGKGVDRKTIVVVKADRENYLFISYR